MWPSTGLLEETVNAAPRALPGLLPVKSVKAPRVRTKKASANPRSVKELLQYTALSRVKFEGRAAVVRLCRPPVAK